MLARYFFVPLAIGILMVVAGTPGARTGASRSRPLAWTLIGFGVFGALNGVPYYYSQIRESMAARQHFQNLCEKSATVELPSALIPAEGVLWADVGQSRASFLSSRDHYTDFVGPGRGRYLAVGVPQQGSDELSVAVWDAARGLDDLRARVAQQAASVELPFEVRTRSVATAADRRFQIDGIETTIAERVSGKVIAKRVVYGRYDGTSSWKMPDAVCPAGAIRPADCNSNGCSVLPFVVKAVPPLLPHDLSKAFHLYSGSGKSSMHCSFEIAVGPGVREEDVEWWSTDGTEDASFRAKGTTDEFVCRNFYYAGGLNRTIWFTESGASYSLTARTRPTKDKPAMLLSSASSP